MRAMMNAAIALSTSADIIHVFAAAQVSTGFPAILAGKVRRIPLFVDFDDLWPGGLAEHHNNVIAFMMDYLERSAARSATSITVVSDMLLSRVRSFGISPDRISKLPNGSNVKGIRYLAKEEARRELGIPIDLPVLVSMGHSYFGGEELFLRAIEEVRETLPATHVYLVGKIQNLHRALASRLEGDGHAVMCGELPYDKAMTYLSAADVLLLPMANNGIEAARWPIRLGDYLAAGRPIVSNAVGEVREVLQRYSCGLATSPESPSELARGILTVLEDSRMAASMGRLARKAAEEVFDWELLARDLHRRYLSFAA